MGSSPQRAEAMAPAKINLFLHLVGRRPDGYHLIDSVFVFTDLADRLTAEPADALSLDVSGPFGSPLAAEPDNLVLRAAHLVQQRAGISAGARIYLDKQIPVAAGLGGGSADAAATLKACTVLWGLALTREELHDVALELGADVPACIESEPVRVQGIGERLDQLDGHPGWGLVLVNPRVAVATREIFATYKASGTSFRQALEGPLPWTDLGWLAGCAGNDLEQAAIRVAPAVADVLDILSALRGCRVARMSGSGATCFGLFETVGAAQRAQSEVAAAHPGWWSWAGGLR